MTIDDLRRHAVTRSLFPPTTLRKALEVLGFVQADPIRAPARAQDLTLRHRVANYRAGDLERQYARLHIHEDFFINYGFVTDRVFRLMHPRRSAAPWSRNRGVLVKRLLEFISARGPVHPRDVDTHFALGTITNYWGGSSNATTHLLDAMHYRGLLRVVRREAGIRIYGLQEHAAVVRLKPDTTNADIRLKPDTTRADLKPDTTNGDIRLKPDTTRADLKPDTTRADLTPGTTRERLDALVDVVVNIYAPLPAASLAFAVRRLRYAAPQWSRDITDALQRARKRLAHARVDGVDWYWPAGETPDADEPGATVRLLAPFDPVVWDRRRFELLWNWAYRFEAYTPVAKRKWGYYALPLLWRDRVIGWANAALNAGELTLDVGYVSGQPPRDRQFRRALADERERLQAFLRV